MFQGVVSSIAKASTQTEEEKERKKARERARYCRKRNRCMPSPAWGCTSVVWEGVVPRVRERERRSACERKGRASGKSGINIITFPARNARGENS